MESTMKEELVIYTGTKEYERSKNRLFYRNGYYKRALVTQFGTISETGKAVRESSMLYLLT
jgi:transposase-like protein